MLLCSRRFADLESGPDFVHSAMPAGAAEDPLGKRDCALCLAGPLQMWGLVTAHMITRWLREHGEPPRDSRAKQKGVHAYRQVAICRMCMQQFSLDRADAVGSSGPDVDVQVSPARQREMAEEAKRTRKQFNADEQKKNFQLSLESQYRHHLHVTALSQQRDAERRPDSKRKRRKGMPCETRFRPQATSSKNEGQHRGESG